METSRVEIREAARETAIVKEKLKAIEGWRYHETHVLRAAGRDAVDSLKVIGRSMLRKGTCP